jgi:hypothetical protein
MDLTLALLADYANISAEGKLNVLGIFDQINVPSLPVIHLEMRLILRFEAGPAERGSMKTVEIKLLEADGQVLFHAGGELALPVDPPRLTSRFNQIITLQHIQFTKAGSYGIHILVNGETKGVATFDVVVQSPASSLPSGETSS